MACNREAGQFPQIVGNDDAICKESDYKKEEYYIFSSLLDVPGAVKGREEEESDDENHHCHTDGGMYLGGKEPAAVDRPGNARDEHKGKRHERSGRKPIVMR